MKQLLSLFLFLLPCLAWAQYPSNGNQKITLGEQTTSDGLIYRGVLGDTALITPSSDTSAYIILDTANHRFYNYNRATNVWSVAGGGTAVTTFSAGTTGLTPSTATSGAVTLGGTLAVANGGTNASTFTEGSVVFAGASGTYTQDNSNLFFDNTNNRLGVGKSNPVATLDITGPSSSRAMAINGAGNGPYFSFSTGDTTFADIGSLGSLSNNFTDRFDYVINTRTVLGIARSIQLQTAFTTRLTVAGDGTVKIANLAGTGSRAVLADANGVLSAPVSSINTKENVQNLNYGLNELMQINPVSFDYINKDKWGEERNLGFIVEDMFSIIPEVTGTMNNGDIYLDMTKLIPVLTKAIQEQQALIKALEQRIINLENK
jgi:hypothetical protein